MTHKPGAVFFDWDGTLVDSFVFLHAAHNYARANLSLPAFTLDDFEGYFGQPREILYEKLYGSQKEDAKKHFETYVRDNHKNIKPHDGAENILKALAGQGVPCGVVTNKKREFVEAEIAGLGWSHYFEVLVGAADAEEDKPSPKPLILANERMGRGITLENTWFIGDTDNDLACAQGGGAKPVLIAKSEHAAPLLEEYDVFLHFENCQKFADFLLQSA